MNVKNLMVFVNSSLIQSRFAVAEVVEAPKDNKRLKRKGKKRKKKLEEEEEEVFGFGGLF
eukprot:gnl/Chilomastix_caulleri/8368.p2 GENE.gnl/Chilomastix_caulleri/8368~~gnl/Chilomastix_caulleri/8368.p2  ORF type:complete len:60 (-),score=22.91 gnl/Chilomastix_caulleri/8368:58-237(-)